MVIPLDRLGSAVKSVSVVGLAVKAGANVIRSPPDSVLARNGLSQGKTFPVQLRA